MNVSMLEPQERTVDWKTVVDDWQQHSGEKEQPNLNEEVAQ